MTTGSILLGAALLLLVILLVTRPFLTFNRARRAYISERHQLETEKEALLLQIQQLDFDHDTGKIPSPIHERQRSVLVEEAAEVIKSLDNLKANGRAPGGRLQEIEAAIARLRGPAPSSEPEAEAGPPAPTPVAGKTAFCPQCGAQVDRTDKFCANCGHALQRNQETAAAGHPS